MSRVEVLVAHECNRVKSVCAHPVRPWVILSLHSGEIIVWDTKLSQVVRKYEIAHQLHKGPVRGVHFHKIMPLFVSGGDDFNIVVWNFKDDKLVCELQGHVDYIRTVEFHSELPWVVSASDDQTIRIWNYESRSCVSVIAGHSHYVMSAQFHPSADLILSSSLDGNARLWSFESYKKSGKVQLNTNYIDIECIKVMSGHQRGVNWACFHPTNNYMASASDDKTIRLWKYSGGVVWHTTTLNGHSHNVCSVLFQPSLDVLVSNSEDRSLKVWNYKEGQFLYQFRLDKDRFWALCCLQSPCLIASGHDSGFLLMSLQRKSYPFAVTKKGNLICKYGEEQQLYEFEGESKPQKLAWSKGQTSQLVYSAIQDAFILMQEKGGKLYKVGCLLECQKLTHGCFFSGLALLLLNDKIKAVNLDSKAQLHIGLASFKVTHLYSANQKYLFAVLEDDRFIEVQIETTFSKKALAPKKGYESKGRLLQAKGSKSGEHIALRFQKQIWIFNSEMQQVCKVVEQQKIESVVWDEQQIIFYSTDIEIRCYFLTGQSLLYSCLDRPKQLIDRKNGVLTYFSQDASPSIKELETRGSEEVNLKLAITKGDWHRLGPLMAEFKPLGHSFNAYLKQIGLGKFAAQFVTQPRSKLDLALSCGSLELAVQICEQAKDQQLWRQIEDPALKAGNFPVYESALIEMLKLEKLSFLYMLQGSKAKLRKMLVKAQKKGDIATRFNNAIFCNDVAERIKVLVETKNYSLAYILAEANGFAQVVSQLQQFVDKSKLQSGGRSHKAQCLQASCEDEGGWAQSAEPERSQIIMDMIKSK